MFEEVYSKVSQSPAPTPAPARNQADLRAFAALVYGVSVITANRANTVKVTKIFELSRGW
jgi:hypothetical protein